MKSRDAGCRGTAEGAVTPRLKMPARRSTLMAAGRPCSHARHTQARSAQRTIMDILCREGWRLKMTTSPLTMCRSTL